MVKISKGGLGKTLYIELSIYPCGAANPRKNLTISCPDIDTRFKTTLLIVTHNKSLAQFAKRVIVIEDGVVQAEGVTHVNFPGVTL